jgi:hypothetical protein
LSDLKNSLKSFGSRVISVYDLALDFYGFKPRLGSRGEPISLFVIRPIQGLDGKAGSIQCEAVLVCHGEHIIPVIKILPLEELWNTDTFVQNELNLNCGIRIIGTSSYSKKGENRCFLTPWSPVRGMSARGYAKGSLRDPEVESASPTHFRPGPEPCSALVQGHAQHSLRAFGSSEETGLRVRETFLPLDALTCPKQGIHNRFTIKNSVLGSSDSILQIGAIMAFTYVQRDLESFVGRFPGGFQPSF